MSEIQSRSTVVYRLPPALIQAIAEAAPKLGKDSNALVEEILTEWAVRKELVPAESLERLHLRHALVEEACDAAVAICAEGRFSGAVTRDVFLAKQRDADFLVRYRQVVGGDPFLPLPAKAALNREIGAAIREAIGGVVETDAAGRPLKRKVSGMIIGAYTVMRSFDETAYATRGAA